MLRPGRKKCKAHLGQRTSTIPSNHLDRTVERGRAVGVALFPQL
jgi:hypothetical protein